MVNNDKSNKGGKSADTKAPVPASASAVKAIEAAQAAQAAESTAVVVSTSKGSIADAAVLGALAGKFKVKKAVTLPTLKLVDDIVYAVKFDGPLTVAPNKTEAGSARADGTRMPPPVVANVINLQNGMLCRIVAKAVLKNELEENYPDQSYVGKSFAMRFMKIEGKRYKGVELAELEETA